MERMLEDGQEILGNSLYLSLLQLRSRVGEVTTTEKNSF